MIASFNLSDNCIFGKWEEENCDCESRTKTSRRKVLRNAVGGGICNEDSEKIEPCDCERMFGLFHEKEIDINSESFHPTIFIAQSIKQ